MATTKSQLIASLSQPPFNYIGIGAPVNPNSEGEVNGITKYVINVFETGRSSENQQPTGYRKNIVFYVYHEGQGDEAAYFEQLEPQNTSNTDPSFSTSSYANIAKLYNSQELQDKCLSAVITQCASVFMEDSSTVNHTNRMLLVALANKDTKGVTMKFMSALALNSSVQAAGVTVADSSIASIVQNSWNAYANLQADYYTQLANSSVVNP